MHPLSTCGKGLWKADVDAVDAPICSCRTPLAKAKKAGSPYCAIRQSTANWPKPKYSRTVSAPAEAESCGKGAIVGPYARLRPGAKLGLQLAGVANLAMAAGFAWMSRR